MHHAPCYNTVHHAPAPRVETIRLVVTLHLVPELGSLYSLSIDPAAVVAAVRESDAVTQVVGDENEWRQIIITPADDADKKPCKLTLTLKIRDIDQLFFRKIVPELLTRASQIPAANQYRQHHLESLIPHFSACVEMVAEPAFSAHASFLDAMTRIARLIEGIFIIPAGFLDSESREILMSDGSSNPHARLPTVPDYPTVVIQTDSIVAPIESPAHAFEEAFEPTFEPPNARRVAERMYAMLAVAYRGVLDVNRTRPNRDAYLARLGDWFWSLEIGHELEDHERHILDQPLGGIDEDDAYEISQQLEAVSVLAWALGLIELPAHDQFVHAKRLGDVLGLFREDTRFVIDSADLRNELDLRAQGDRIMAAHWRLREYELNPNPVDFASMCRDSWFGPIDLSDLPTADKDLALAGLPITQADRNLRERVLIATEHRHRAINWICGHHPVFSQVDIST